MLTRDAIGKFSQLIQEQEQALEHSMDEIFLAQEESTGPVTPDMYVPVRASIRQMRDTLDALEQLAHE